MPSDATVKLLSVGDFMFDIVVRPSGPVRHGTDTRATIERKPGGSAANMAAWLATTGVRPALAAAIGQDDLDAVSDLMRAHGIRPELQAVSGVSTGTLINLIDSGGERSFLTDRGANDFLDITPAIPRLLDGLDHLHVSGYAATATAGRASVSKLMSAARANGIPISVDAGSAAFVEEIGADEFLRWARPCSVLISNDEEADVLTRSTTANRRFEILSDIAETIVIKSGAAGVSARDRASGATLTDPAPAVEPADTTGAGDAFLAGFLSQRFRGRGLAEQLAGGTRLAGSALTNEGGFPARV